MSNLPVHLRSSVPEHPPAKTRFFGSIQPKGVKNRFAAITGTTFAAAVLACICAGGACCRIRLTEGALLPIDHDAVPPSAPCGNCRKFLGKPFFHRSEDICRIHSGQNVLILLGAHKFSSIPAKGEYPPIRQFTGNSVQITHAHPNHLTVNLHRLNVLNFKVPRQLSDSL